MKYIEKALADLKAMHSSNSDIIRGIQWLGTLDLGICLHCGVLDGLRWELPDLKPAGHEVPFPNQTCAQCRCTLLPWLKSWCDLASEAGGDIQVASKMDALSELGTRASCDGQVPASLRYDQWLKSKNLEFQSRVLGEQDAKRYSRDEITLRELIRERSSGPN